MTYIVLCTFDATGRATLVSGQDPREVADPVAQEVGATVEQLYLTTGNYDAVVILDADSIRTALAFAVAFGEAAGTTTLTLSAEGASARVVDAANRAHTRIGHTRIGHSRG
jgi:uncharacterized protein with GYD domain